MNDDALKAAVGQFLRHVNVTAQRELEKAIRKAVAGGKLRGNETCNATVTVASDRLGLDVTIHSKIAL